MHQSHSHNALFLTEMCTCVHISIKCGALWDNHLIYCGIGTRGLFPSLRDITIGKARKAEWGLYLNQCWIIVNWTIETNFNQFWIQPFHSKVQIFFLKMPPVIWWPFVSASMCYGIFVMLVKPYSISGSFNSNTVPSILLNISSNILPYIS